MKMKMDPVSIGHSFWIMFLCTHINILIDHAGIWPSGPKDCYY